MSNMSTAMTKRNPSESKKKAWNHQEKRIKIDVNRFRAKYDFDVAVKICPMRSGIAYNDDF